jgi:hypothetical protein
MAAGPDGRWEIGIGDPTPLGWITVAAYAAAAVLAWRNAGAARRTAVPHSFWIALTALMLALGINKQLDLQTWLSQAGRDLAIAQGWWEQRRAVQAVFIALLAAGAVGVAVWARRQWHTLWHEYRAAFVGVCVLLCHGAACSAATAWPSSCRSGPRPPWRTWPSTSWARWPCRCRCSSGPTRWPTGCRTAAPCWPSCRRVVHRRLLARARADCPAAQRDGRGRRGWPG